MDMTNIRHINDINTGLNRLPVPLRLPIRPTGWRPVTILDLSYLLSGLGRRVRTGDPKWEMSPSSPSVDNKDVPSL